MKKTTTKQKTQRVYDYQPIAKNVYFDGKRYRVRISVDGERYDQYFTSKRKALAFKKEVTA